MSESNKLPLLTAVKDASKKKKTPRCCARDCNKKIGLISFECKCGLSFCGKHKHPEDHECSYNHKHDAIISLKQKLIKVDGNKIIPI